MTADEQTKILIDKYCCKECGAILEIKYESDEIFFECENGHEKRTDTTKYYSDIIEIQMDNLKFRE